MSFTDLKNAQTRLVVLQLLTTAEGYEVNEGILADLLRRYAISISRDVLRTQLAWLAEQGLVSLTEVAGDLGGGLYMAKLTMRGDDAAHGRAIIPGVKRPGPEDSI